MASVNGAHFWQFASDEVNVSVCNPCHYNGTEKEPTYFCQDCKECLCRNCAAAHKGLRISRNHKISDLGVLGRPISTSGVTCNIFCSCNYMNLEVAVYCEDHDDVMCVPCKTITHGKCQTVLISEKCASYLPKKLTYVAEKAKALKDETDSFLKERHLDMKKLATMKEKCKNDIKTFRNELITFAELLEQNTLKELESLEIQQRQDIERHLSTITTTKQMVEADEKVLNDAIKSSEKLNMFAAAVKTSNRLKDYKRLLQDIRHEVQPPIFTFHQQNELTELQTKVTKLGTLNGVDPEAFKSKAVLFTDMTIEISSEVDIKLPGDDSTPYISGCAFLPDGQAILCDINNNNVKILSNAFTVTEVLQLQSRPWNVSVLNNSNAVITLPFNKQIQFLQTAPKLKAERMIQLDKRCWGIKVAGEEIYVSCHEDWQNGEVRVLDMVGNCIRGLCVNQDGTFLFAAPFYVTLSADAATLYVSDAGTNTVTCLKTDGTVINKYQDMNSPRGICVDGEGNMVVCSQGSSEVYVISADGRQNKTLLLSKDGIKEPRYVAFIDGTFIFGCHNNTKSFVYKVK